MKGIPEPNISFSLMLIKAAVRLGTRSVSGGRVLRANYATETNLPKDKVKILVVGAGALPQEIV